WQHLDGHVPIELGIGGAIHGAHPALAELGGDLVVGDLEGRGHLSELANRIIFGAIQSVRSGLGLDHGLYGDYSGQFRQWTSVRIASDPPEANTSGNGAFHRRLQSLFAMRNPATHGW